MATYQKHLVKQSNPQVLVRVLSGDTSIQALAELSIYYVLQLQEHSKRYDVLRHMRRGDMVDLYREYELDRLRPVTKRLAVWEMALMIATLEYPTKEYEEALANAGLDVKSLGKYEIKHIGKAVLLYY